MAAKRFEPTDSLARQQASEDQLFLMKTVGRNDQRDVLADRFMRMVSKHQFGSRIPREDDACGRLRDQRIDRRLDDRLEQALRSRAGSFVRGPTCH